MDDLFSEIVTALENKENFVVATVIAVRGEAKVAVSDKLMVKETGEVLGALGGGVLEANVVEDCRQLQRDGQSRTLTYFLNGERNPSKQRAAHKEPGIDVFIEVFQGQLTLVISGGGHVGQAIAHVAHFAGWRVVVIDDRPAFANAERFPEAAEIIVEEYDKALSNYPITSSTYVVCVTRGHKHDEVSLRAVVRSDAKYIGMIGSKRRVSTVLRHMEEEGIPREYLDRVWTPIGLDIEAETPEEIAISVVAEMIMVRHGGTGIPLSYKERKRERAKQLV